MRGKRQVAVAMGADMVLLLQDHAAGVLDRVGNFAEMRNNVV